MEDRLEEPNEEGLDGEGAALLKRGVEWRILHDNVDADVVVEHEGEHGQARVHRRVAQDQHAVVDWDGDEVEHAREDCLDHGDDKAAMDHELRKDSTALVTEAAMPQNQASKLFELVDGEVRRERRLHTFLADDSYADV